MYKRYGPAPRRPGQNTAPPPGQQRQGGGHENPGNGSHGQGMGHRGNQPAANCGSQNGGQQRKTPQNNLNNRNMHPPASEPHDRNAHWKPPEKSADKKFDSAQLLTKFIPQSVYNPETGKILGFLSAEDLLIAALILLLIDNGDDEEDNSMLIFALVYILLSGHMDLPI